MHDAATLLLEAIKLAPIQPQKAAKILDVLALQIHAWANTLRAAEGYQAHGGFGDKVTIALVGPDGEVKKIGEV